MIFKIAIRNLWLNLSRRSFLILIIIATLAILLLGNALLVGTQSGTQRAYRDAFTGDFSVSAQSEEPFSIIGNEMPLVGEYEVVPALVDSQKVADVLAEIPGVESYTRQISSAARLDLSGFQLNSLVFGVEFSEYFRFFPSLKIVQGKLPEKNEKGLFLSASRLATVEKAIGRQLKIGEMVVLTVYTNASFTIRQLPYSGVYAYPVSDQILERVVLVDADTARALNGYIYGSSRKVEVSAEATALLGNDQSIEDLFGEKNTTTTIDSGAVDPDRLLSLTASSSETQSAAVVVPTAWNFFLVKARAGFNVAELMDQVRERLDPRSVQIRDWRGTAGGNAGIVYLIIVLFNLGMLFVAAVAAFVITNSLAISVYERTKEIGTMRALGTTRSRIFQLLLIETGVLIGGAGIIGITLGSIASLWIAGAGLPLDNPFLVTVFGSQTLQPVLTGGLLLAHFGLVFVVGLGALLWPLRIAFAITPIRAMAQE